MLEDRIARLERQMALVIALLDADVTAADREWMIQDAVREGLLCHGEEVAGDAADTAR